MSGWSWFLVAINAAYCAANVIVGQYQLAFLAGCLACAFANLGIYRQRYGDP